MLNQFKQKGVELLGYHIIDIETGIAPDAQKFMPKFEYRYNKKHTHQEELVDIKIQENDWKKQCPLHAVTGRVIVIGHLGVTDKPIIIGVDETEEQILEHFWNTILQCYDNGTSIVGHNIRMFDFPFLIRRSWKLKVKVPWLIWQSYKGATHHPLSGVLDNWIIDISDLWLMDSGTRYYRYQTKPSWQDNLDVRMLPKWNQNTISHFLGGQLKPFDGKNFETVWNKDKAAAIQYLIGDLFQAKYNLNQMLQESDYELPF